MPTLDLACADPRCSGRHEIDGTLRCRRCGGTAYTIIMHERRGHEGHYFYSLRPVNGAAEIVPRDPPTCCGEPMRRT